MIDTRFEAYESDPPKFVREILGNEVRFDRNGNQIGGNFPKQDEILMSVLNNMRTVVRAPNGAGKSEVAAQAVLWASSLFEHTYVITTASTGRQVQLLWKKVHDMYYKSKVKLGGELLQSELRFPKLFTTCKGFATDDPGRFEGFHEERIFVIIDEAKSVPQTIFDATERLLTSGKWIRLLVISSPGSPIGPFYDCFTRHSDIYKTFHITMGESPYVRREYIEERKRKWGPTSPLFLSSCMGDFSIDADGRIIIPLTYVQRICEKPPEWDPKRGAVAGIDLAAGGGDESVFSLVVGNCQMALKRWNERDTMVTCNNIIKYFKQFRKEYGLEAGNVNIDNGGMGIGVCDRLRELGYDFNRFNFGGNPIEGTEYYDAGAEVWYEAGKLIENQLVGLIPHDHPDGQISLHDLQNQLCGRMTKPRSDGLIQLESKEEMRKRQLPSPDLADATILSLAGRRNVELRMENCLDGEQERPPEKDPEAELEAYLKRQQEAADKIREEREANG